MEPLRTDRSPTDGIRSTKDSALAFEALHTLPLMLLLLPPPLLRKLSKYIILFFFFGGGGVLGGGRGRGPGACLENMIGITNQPHRPNPMKWIESLLDHQAAVFARLHVI